MGDICWSRGIFLKGCVIISVSVLNSVEYHESTWLLTKNKLFFAHLEAIAQILYDESDPEAIKTLEGIELTVRQQIQTQGKSRVRGFFIRMASGTQAGKRRSLKSTLGEARDHHSASRKASRSILQSIESASARSAVCVWVRICLKRKPNKISRIWRAFAFLPKPSSAWCIVRRFPYPMPTNPWRSCVLMAAKFDCARLQSLPVNGETIKLLSPTLE